jgi:hypothetical protein
VLSAGTHVITLEGVNGGGAGGIGAEIYGPFPPGSTANDDAMVGLDYANNVVFTSLDQIGDVFDTGVTSGFSCEAGFALDLCGDAPLCTRFERVDACEVVGEICDDGIDNDGDTDIDCGDIDCRDAPGCDIERTFYFTTPAQSGNPTPAAPTRLYATNAAGQPQLLGDITVDGVPVIVTAIALTTGGTLIGFMFDPAGPTSTAIVIDPDTAIGVRVDAPPAPVHVIGAGYDPQNRLWVLDRTNQQIREYTQLGGLEAPLMPFPVQLDGGDIAFDQNGDCYLTGDSLNGDVQRDLYRCDLAARTTTSLGPLSVQGFVDGVGGVFVSGMAFSLDDETCESTLFALDGKAIDELGVIDVSGEPPTITQVASTGINFSWYTNPDGAGFPSVANSPACDR